MKSGFCMVRDLTKGKPDGVLLRFCLPLFASVIFQQLYNIADSFVAGKFLGNDALAAVGNSYEITLIFISIAFGCNIGVSVVAARLFGAKKYDYLRASVSTAFVSAGALSLILVVIGLIGCRPLLTLIKTPEELFGASATYLYIYVYGLPFMFIYNISTGIFSALGDSRTPLLFLAASSVSNVAVDILFVSVFDMGVAGVAWATFICQGISGVLAFVFVIRRVEGLGSILPVRRFILPLLYEIAEIAIPSILQQSFISVGNIVIQSVINGFGTSVMAGYSASVKLNNMVTTSLTTLGNGISSFTAQNLGAGKSERVRQGFFAGVRMVLVICVPIVMLYFMGARRLVYLFLDSPTGEAVDAGSSFLRIVSPFYFVMAAKLVADGVLRGAGMMKRFMVTTFADLLLRVVIAEVLSGTALGVTGIWLAWPVGWIVSTTLSLVFCFTVRWQEQRARMLGG